MIKNWKKILFVLVIGFFCFGKIYADDGWSPGDDNYGDSSEDDASDEGYSDNESAMSDDNFYNGGYDDDIDDSVTMEELIHNYNEAVTAYLQATGGSKDSTKTIEEAARDLNYAYNAMVMYADAHQDQYSVTYTGGHTVEIHEKGSNTLLTKAGDPVILFGGIFVMDFKDLEAEAFGTRFTLNRYFSSEEWMDDYKSGGSFGNKWASVLDSRIIRGSMNRLDQAVAEWKDEIESLKGTLNQIYEWTQEDPLCEEILSDMLELYLEEYGKYEEFLDLYKHSRINASASLYSSYGYGGFYAAQAGNDVLVYVDEIGTPIVFERNNEYVNLYECTYHKLKDRMTLQIGDELIPVPVTEEVSFTAEEIVSEEAMSDDGETDDIEIEDIATENTVSEKIGSEEEDLRVRVEKMLETPVPFYQPDETFYFEEANYYLTKLNGEKIIFDSNGFIIRQEFENGAFIDFHRNLQEQVETVSVNGIEKMHFEWNGTNLVSVRRGDLKVEYSYENGMLASFKNVDGDLQKFSYDQNMNLEKFVKADGKFSAFEYTRDDDGKLRTGSTTNEEGRKEFFDYFLNEKKTIYTDYDGFSAVAWFDDVGQIIKQIDMKGLLKELIWNDKSQLLSEHSAGNSVQYEYDEKGNRISARFSDGSWEQWNYQGNRLCSYKNRDGTLYEIEYADDKGQIVLKKNGIPLHSAYYDRRGTIICEINSEMLVKKYEYDKKGMLTRIQIVSFETGIIEEVKYRYDESDRLIEIQDAHGNEVKIQYADHRMKFVFSKGVECEVTYSSRKDVVKVVKRDIVTGWENVVQCEWDGCHNMLKRYENGKLTEENFYSPGGRLLKKVRAFDDRKCITFEYLWKNGEIAQFKNYFSDNQGNALGEKNVTDFSYQWEPGGRKVTIKTGKRIQELNFDLEGRLVSKYENGKLLEKNEYSPEGKLLTSKKGPKGIVAYDYDAMGFCSSIGEVDGTLGKDYAEFSPSGKLISYKNRTGTEHRYSYETNGKLSQDQTAYGTVRYEYDNNNELSKKQMFDASEKMVYEESWTVGADSRIIEYCQGEKYRTTFYLDGFGKVLKKSDGAGNIHTFEYDGFGNCIIDSDSYGNETKMEYNLDGSLRKIIFPDGKWQSYEYDCNSNCIAIKNELGTVCSYRFDESNRLVSKTDSAFAQEFYEYDEFDRITKITRGNIVSLQVIYEDKTNSFKTIDAQGNLKFYKTDGFGRIVYEKRSDGAVSTRQYEKNASVLKEKTFGGKEVNFEYAKDGSEVKALFGDNQYVHEKRDLKGNLLCSENQNGSIEFKYDSGAKLIHQKDSISGSEVAFDYDARGLLSKVTSSKGTVAYEYGKNAELKRVNASANLSGTNGLVSIEIDYDVNGRIVRRKFGNFGRQDYFYDEAGRLNLTAGFDSKGQVIFVEGKVFDERGCVVLQLNSDFSVTRYSYDEMGRLASTEYAYSEKIRDYMSSICASSGFYLAQEVELKKSSFSIKEHEQLQALCRKIQPGTYQPKVNFTVVKESYEYDKNGNMVRRINPFGVIEYVYDSENRLIRWGNGCTAEYDANGNLVNWHDAYEDKHFSYTAENRLEGGTVWNRLKEKNYTFSYKYDGLGRRVFEEDSERGSFVTVYQGTGFKELYKIQTSNASVTKDYVPSENTGFRYQTGRTRVSGQNFDSQAESLKVMIPLYADADSPLALFTLEDNGHENGVLYFLSANGSVGASLEMKSLLTDRIDYEVFGGILSSSKKVEYGFAGKSYDSFTKSCNFGYRDYDLIHGRFTTEDPIRFGMNWYSYCDANPVCFVDRYGLLISHLPDAEMQTEPWGSQQLGNSTKTGETVAREGCLVTGMATVLQEIFGANIDPSLVNSLSGFFGANSGNLDLQTLSNALGLSYDVTKTSSITFTLDTAMGLSLDAVLVGLASLDFTASVIFDLLEGLEEQDVKHNLLAEVRYCNDNSKSHFVSVTGGVQVIDGKSYVPIATTSRNDRSVGKDSMRGGVGWIMVNGQIFVPVNDIVSLRDFSKD